MPKFLHPYPVMDTGEDFGDSEFQDFCEDEPDNRSGRFFVILLAVSAAVFIVFCVGSALWVAHKAKVYGAPLAPLGSSVAP